MGPAAFTQTSFSALGLGCSLLTAEPILKHKDGSSYSLSLLDACVRAPSYTRCAWYGSGPG